VIGRHNSTISRELTLNRGQRVYLPRQAHFKALNRHSHRQIRILQDTWDLIEAKQRLDWCPDQISGWTRKNLAIRVSHEWIYQHILVDKWMRGTLIRHLRCQKKRRKRYGGYDRRGQLPNRVSIEKRSTIVEHCQRFGVQWVGFTIPKEWLLVQTHSTT
jgi:IS30 family transposase